MCYPTAVFPRAIGNLALRIAAGETAEKAEDKTTCRRARRVAEKRKSYIENSPSCSPWFYFPLCLTFFFKMNEKKTHTVLFVCTGNTCRSPMAVGLLRELAGPDTYRILSAGTGASQGMPPSLYAREVMEEEGIDISAHRSQMLDANMLEEAEIVLVMAECHRRQVTDWFRSYADKVRLLREFDPVRNDPDYPNIPDPMGQGKEAYVKCREMIHRSLERAIHEL